jgi:CheY-like chemotaxis protein
MNQVRRESPTRELQRPRTEVVTVSSRQRRVLVQLEERARRIELVAALAGAGGFEAERAANILCAELAELELSTSAAGLEGLGGFARAVRKLTEHIGNVKIAHWKQRDVIVFDDDEITRDLITLALQAEGHKVRSAGNLAELSMLVSERKPHVLLSEARMPEAPGSRLCQYLRVTMALEKIPIVIFSSARGDELAQLAHEAGADLYLSKDQGVSDLTAEVSRLFQEILW